MREVEVEVWIMREIVGSCSNRILDDRGNLPRVT